MTDLMWGVLLTSAIIGVAFLCWRQWKILESLKSKARTQTQEIEEQGPKYDLDLKESARTIALCVLQDQVDLSEGCWRLKLHLDHLWPNEDDRKDFEVFYQMFDEIKGFATHKERAALSAQMRFDQDKARLAIEARYKDELIQASRLLVQQLDATAVS